MTPLDPTITSPGNTELSPMDITKLQKAYGCDSCGGYKRATEGFISGVAMMDQGPCAWVIETEKGKGIILNITGFVGSSCQTDFVELRLGRSSDSPLVARFCADNKTSIRVPSSVVWVGWTKTEGAMGAKWSTYEGARYISKVEFFFTHFIVECCALVIIESLGLFSSLEFNRIEINNSTQRPLYKIADGGSVPFFLYWLSDIGWLMGSDPTSTTANAISQVIKED